MAKRSSIDQYQSKLAEARKLAKGAATDLRGRANALVTELRSLAEIYQQLTGQPLPEVSGAVKAGRAGGARRGAAARGRKAGGGGRRGKRPNLSGGFAGKTIPEAVMAAIGKSKTGLGPKEIAEKIGGNRNSIAVAMSGMVKEGLIKRIEHGKYIAA